MRVEYLKALGDESGKSKVARLNPRLCLWRKARLANNKWRRNGVSYLRNRFLEHIRDVEGWDMEGNVDLKRDRHQPAIRLCPSLEPYCEPVMSDFGGFDLVTVVNLGTRVAIEWETGNISSSHCSMNKLAIALGAGIIQIGVLILPSRAFYEHLTDRIGNIGELSRYLSMWEALNSTVIHGMLALVVVGHDELTEDPISPFLTTGMDGRAAEGKAST